MIGCDGPCQNWYHPKCIGLSNKVLAELKKDKDSKFMCDICQILQPLLIEESEMPS
jgi:hypothetical protein